MPVTLKNNRFHLYNENMSYVIEISRQKDLLNMHFGGRIDPDDLELPSNIPGAFFCCADEKDENYSLSVLPQEYPSAGASDFRSPAIEIVTETGIHTPEFKYKRHKMIKGKPELIGLPAVYTESEDEAETLVIIAGDEQYGIEIELYYTVFDKLNVVCRHCEIINISDMPVSLRNAQSVNLDLPPGEYGYIHLPGAWAREKHIERCKIHRGMQGFESRRGASGHEENPFMMVFEENADEDHGCTYGISLVYSGNHRFVIEKDMYENVRVQAGIDPFSFEFRLESNDRFVTPEAVMVYSGNGFADMSNTFHKLYRTRLCRGKWRDKERPILINNWEATYFDFNKNKLLSIADKAAEAGIELFVLDDGWFGNRNNDRSSLGDWYENKEKLGGSLAELAGDINDRGLMFGLWVEPEMVSPDSELYRKHPEWAIKVPGVAPHLSRHQLVLDYTRKDVRDHIVDRLASIFGNANIEYVKWDMNRNITDAYSCALPPERQGEFYHRYILGLYEVLERLTSAFPDILFEGCSGGGGRNDPGMLYYMPQNWSSDGTDAEERLYIQYGGSMIYPASTVGAHVSAVPNHQTGRISPISMRGTVAMNGAFGYELDLTQVDDDEFEEIKSQVRIYKKIRGLVMTGAYYRLKDPYNTRHASWMYVSEDKKRALVYFIVSSMRPSNEIVYLKLKGLDPCNVYKIKGKKYKGSTLMNRGIMIDRSERYGDCVLFELDAEI